MAPVLVALLALLSALTGRPESPQAAQRPSPNVIVIVTDDQPRSMMRGLPHTRRLLGRRGTTFTRAYANFPLCCPARATLLTGQYAHNHGVLENSPPLGGLEAFDESSTVATWLREAGYVTAFVGKYLNGYRDAREHVPPGWSVWKAATTPNMYYRWQQNLGGRLVDHGARRADYQTDVLARQAVRFVKRQAPRAEPFLLWLSVAAPHIGGPEPSPRVPRTQCTGAAKPAPRHARLRDRARLPRPPSFNEVDVSDKPSFVRQRTPIKRPGRRIIRRHYRCNLESLAAVDEAVRRIVRALRAAGALRNTYLLFTTDNGYMYGEHRILTGKRYAYDPVSRIPLLARGPGFGGGRKLSRLVSNADIAATIADVTGADPDLVLDGQSLLAPPGAWPRALLIVSATYEAIRTGRFMYIEHRNGERELYDMKRDPHQLESRHADPKLAGVRAQLADELDALRGCAGGSCRAAPPPALN